MKPKTKNTLIISCILLLTLLATSLIVDPQTGESKMLLGLDLRSGSHIAVQLSNHNDRGQPLEINKSIQEQSIQVFRKRLDPQGNREVVITPEDLDRLIIEIPEVTDLAQAEAMVKKTGKLEFKELEFLPETNQTSWKTRLDGSAVANASPSLADASMGGGWIINFTMTDQGANDFGDITRELKGKPLGIFFDGEQISAPIIENAITSGQGLIRGEFTQEEATTLSNFLNAGALPVEVDILESYTVSPSLGTESIRSSLRAAGFGLSLVSAYVIKEYRLLGMVATLALLVYGVLVLASMNLPGMQFVLSLPGIAGFVLSIGMAVDANILIFERIREELKNKASLQKAVNTGFKKAWTSITDGHVTTFLGAAVLFWLGSASVKGFGLTLMLGTAWSMFTATFVSRYFLQFALDNLGLGSAKNFGMSQA